MTRPIELTPAQRAHLERLVHSGPASQRQRAAVILGLADGSLGTDVASSLAMSKSGVSRLRTAWLRYGMGVVVETDPSDGDIHRPRPSPASRVEAVGSGVGRVTRTREVTDRWDSGVLKKAWGRAQIVALGGLYVSRPLVAAAILVDRRIQLSDAEGNQDCEPPKPIPALRMSNGLTLVAALQRGAIQHPEEGACPFEDLLDNLPAYAPRGPTLKFVFAHERGLGAIPRVEVRADCLCFGTSLSDWVVDVSSVLDLLAERDPGLAESFRVAALDHLRSPPVPFMAPFMWMNEEMDAQATGRITKV